MKGYWIIAVISMMLPEFLYAKSDNATWYINSNYCFSTIRLHLGVEKLSQDGVGIYFGRRSKCAEQALPFGICEGVSVYAEYTVLEEDLQFNWFKKELIEYYKKDGWNINEFHHVQKNNLNWFSFSSSKKIKGKIMNSIVYQARTKNKSTIYTIQAVFEKQNFNEMIFYIKEVFDKFSYSEPCGINYRRP